MKIIDRVINCLVIFLLANCCGILGEIDTKKRVISIVILTGLFIWINFVPSGEIKNMRTARLKVCCGGVELLILFVGAFSLTVVYAIGNLLELFPRKMMLQGKSEWIIHIIAAVFTLAIVFWNGMLRVYSTSTQLGVKWRALGIIFGMVPLAHLYLLGIIIRTVSKEVKFENDKIIINERRKEDKICETKYPILMVHGVFFRDFRFLNYWGRIPEQLKLNGATIFYGNHSSALAVKDSAVELRQRILEIVKETGCDKVNVIAHSKGGLDMREALSDPEIAQHVASLTTINTPHRGCEFADYLLNFFGEKEKNAVATAYNTALKKLGDSEPDFISAVEDLTASACEKRNERLHDVPGLFIQSVGSKCANPGGGRFPLNLTYRFVNRFDGANDGLVGEKSFPWGEKFTFLTVKGKRGISHGDVIDLNRENFDDFDVREFFVQLVADLKQRGF